MNPDAVLVAAWQAFIHGDGHTVAALATNESLTRCLAAP
jgi:hypothetical protein